MTIRYDNGKCAIHAEDTEYLGKSLIYTPKMSRNALNESQIEQKLYIFPKYKLIRPNTETKNLKY